MKILYCIPSLGDGGAEKQLSYLSTELSRMGHDIHVASVSGGANEVRFTAAGIQLHRLGGLSYRDPLILLRLVRLIRKLRPDVVQTILTPMDIMGGAASMLTHTPWLLKESSSAPLYTSGLRYRWRLAIGRRARGIISNSAGGAAYWRSLATNSPLCIVPNSVPFDEIAEARDDLGTEFNIGKDTKVLLFAGRLTPEKNVEKLIDALSRLPSKLSFVAFICGDGPQRLRLEQLAREFGVAHRLIFTGYVSNLWSLMKRADVVISLSKFEGRPNVVLEAMASKCPLVVSDIPAHREILDDNSAAFVDSEDPEQAAKAIEEVLEETVRTKARARVAQVVAAQWTIETTARQYERVYLRLLAGASDLHDVPVISTAE